MNSPPAINNPPPNCQDNPLGVAPQGAEDASPEQAPPLPADTLQPTRSDQLQAIAQAAQAAPPGSPQRNQQLNRLISLAQQSGKLSHPPLRHLKNHSTLYQEIYEEACQRTWCWLCRSIEQYDPKKAAVLTWINNHLKWRIKDVEGEMIDYHQRNHSEPETPKEEWIDLPDTFFVPDLHDSLLELEGGYRESLQLYLTRDPDQLLARTMKSRPDISLKQIVVAKIAGEKMTTIARSLDVNYQSLSRFFNDRRDTLYASIQAFHEQF